MRQTQIIGLSPQALTFLKENEAKTLEKCYCPDCKTPHVEISLRKQYADGSHWGMFDDGPPLYKYQLKDGSWVCEFVQSCPWSSGPMIFLALTRVVNESIEVLAMDAMKNPVTESLWKEDEI